MIPLAVFTRRFELRYSRDARRAQDLTGDLATSVEESALGIRVIKSYGRRPFMLTSFTRDAATLRSAEMRKVTTLAGFWALLEGWPQLVLAGVAGGGVIAVAHHAMTLGQLVAFLTLYLRLVWPIISLGWLLALTQEARLRLPPHLRGARHRSRPSSTRRTRSSPPPGPVGLRFDHVRFAYPEATTPVLRHIDLDVEPGESMALVGATGSGKTTLTALVARLHDVSGGRVLVGGIDVRDYPLGRLRGLVATAFEEATLFSASVRENVAMGRPGIGDEEVREALEIAQADFVYALPFGLDTRIGEQGLSLSGGQRQRLALARAVAGRPQLLVLDDPLSALDVHTEGEVERALRRVLSASTALIVAHRPSTVLLADRVALLVDGEIAAVGTHSELLADVPEYRNLLAQTSELDELVAADSGGGESRE